MDLWFKGGQANRSRSTGPRERITIRYGKLLRYRTIAVANKLAAALIEIWCHIRSVRITQPFKICSSSRHAIKSAAMPSHRTLLTGLLVVVKGNEDDAAIRALSWSNRSHRFRRQPDSAVVFQLGSIDAHLGWAACLVIEKSFAIIGPVRRSGKSKGIHDAFRVRAICIDHVNVCHG